MFVFGCFIFGGIDVCKVFLLNWFEFFVFVGFVFVVVGVLCLWFVNSM